MGDMYSPEKRSSIMSSIRSKNTRSELLAFRYLNAKKVYYQKHYKRAPGSPDIALPRKKRAVFIDGDFWHGRELDRLVEKKGADNFWTIKITSNIERDKKQRQELLEKGWMILAIWDSDIKRVRTRQHTLDSILLFLTAP